MLADCVVDVDERPAGIVRAVVGGMDHAVGGWGAYEIARREAEWMGCRAKPGDHYPGRAHISGPDAAHSVLTSSRGTVGGGHQKDNKSALQRAALRLADALGALEDRLCEPDEDGVWECDSRGALVVPAVTSADLRAFAEDPAREADPETLYELDEDVAKAVAAVARPLGHPPHIFLRRDYPPLPTRAVPVGDDEAVLRLEAESGPYVAALEEEQAEVATRLEAAAHAIRVAARRERVGGSGAGKRPTRGEEIDTASIEPPPISALKTCHIPSDGYFHEFDLAGDPFRLVESRDGLYCGASRAGLPSRPTVLTPELVGRAAKMTSGRVYAWYILDSSEGRYLVRAAPADGYARILDEPGLVHWLQKRLTGHPPHKIAINVWLKYLRAQGVEIRVVVQRSTEARFDLADMTTAEERTRAITALTALTQPELLGLDWSDYDEAAGIGACTHPNIETAGDVLIDLVAKKVRAVKVRPGIPAASNPHVRSYVQFHTHPLGRFRGGRAEVPSDADLRTTLHACAHDLQAWDFVSAPEGTYMYRPSALLKKLYLQDPKNVRKTSIAVYEDGLGSEREKAGAASVLARAVPALLTEAGFVAYFRESPCASILNVPDIWAWDNSRSRENLREDYERASGLSGEEVLKADWGDIVALFAAPSLPGIRVSWISVCPAKDSRMESAGDGHRFPGEPSDAEAWTDGRYWPGPILALHFAGPLPRRIPRAAIAAAHDNSQRWAWAVFLSADAVMAFRASETDFEIHGPVKLKKAKK